VSFVLEMCDNSYVNNAAIISKNPKVTAINSCIEVDLTGQVVADSIGEVFYSGKLHSLLDNQNQTKALD